jgi:hypothetical protein
MGIKLLPTVLRRYELKEGVFKKSNTLFEDPVDISILSDTSTGILLHHPQHQLLRVLFVSPQCSPIGDKVR